MWQLLGAFGASISGTGVLPAPQAEMVTACISRVQKSETYRRGSRRITSFYFHHRNTCKVTVRFHYCTIASADPAACNAAAMFASVVLRPGETANTDGPGGYYTHARECPGEERLVDFRSRVSNRASVVCEGAAVSAAPETDPGAAFSGMGQAPDLSAPVATVRGTTGVVMSDDYPPDMLRIGAEGVTIVSLAISPDSRVVGCRVKRSSGFASLDRAACAVLMRRGRFNAARDSAGIPVASVYPEYKVGWASN